MRRGQDRAAAHARGAGSSAVAGSDTYQVDVVVTLFAILLILLLTTLAQVAGLPAREARVDYRAVDPPGPVLQLRSLAPIYPYRRVWLAKDGLLTRLDLRRIAERYLAAGGLALEEWLEPADLTVAPMPTGADAFRLEVGFSGPGVPEELRDAQVPMTDQEAAAQALGVSGEGVLVYVWPGEAAALAPILTRLRADGRCHQLVLEPVRDTVAILHNYRLFAGETVLRCY